ncbi:hypothetical protein Bca101_039248 [Brassica carinata]
MQPIFIAIIQNDIPAFLGLVEERELWLEVRNVEQDNSTVLHMAANHGHGELVSKIIELKRSLIFSRNAHGNTPLHLAALLGDVNTVRTLLEFGSETCSQNNNYQTPLHLVCRSISTEAARIFAEKTRFVSLDELKFALSSGSTFAYRNLRQWNLRQWLEEEMCFFNLSSSDIWTFHTRSIQRDEESKPVETQVHVLLSLLYLSFTTLEFPGLNIAN